MLRVTLVVALALGPILGAGCDGERDGEQAGAEEEAREPLSDDPLEAAIQKQARKRTPHMIPEDEPQKGALEEGASTDLAVVLKPPHCYALHAAGGPNVQDLDLFLFDPGDVPVQQDSATDRTAVLGVSEPICPAQAGIHRARVRMVDGHGAFAFQLYRSK